jgi:hypothetical protein
MASPDYERVYNMFRTKYRNQPAHVQKAMREEARQARLAAAAARDVPAEFANANLASLGALRATAKNPFAQKRIPENVERLIEESLGALPYTRTNNTGARRVHPGRNNITRGVLATTKIKNRIAKKKADELARKHEAAMNAYMTAKMTEANRARETRRLAKQKSRARRGHYSINRRVFNNTKGSKRGITAYINKKTNTRKAAPKRRLTERQKIIEKYLVQSMQNNQ